MRQASLLFLVRRGKLCLAIKKAGFGQGRWNGVGGKRERGETIKQTAIRETREEIGVTASQPIKVAILDFEFLGRPEWNQQVHVFLAHTWEGTPRESDEVRPAWFRLAELPFDQMCEDNRLWLSEVLAGRFVKGQFIFDGNQEMTSHTMHVLDAPKLSPLDA